MRGAKPTMKNEAVGMELGLQLTCEGQSSTNQGSEGSM